MIKAKTFSELDVVTMLCCFGELFREEHRETVVTVCKEDDQKAGKKRPAAYYDGVRECYNYCCGLIENALADISEEYNIDLVENVNGFDPMQIAEHICNILYKDYVADPGTVADGAPVHD